MDHLLIMVLDDSERLNEVLAAWREAGIKGITIFESTGLNRVLPRHTAQPMYAGFSQVFGGGRIGHHTLFAVIDYLELAEKAVAATEEILGDLTKPQTGLIWAVPVSKVWGLPEPYTDEAEE
jgi:hypothetical protein